jgi:hypothetical protein
MTRAENPDRVRADLERLWREQALPAYEFRHFEAALIRTGLALRRRARRK